MQKLLRLGAISAMVAGFAFAEDFTGRLLDATCVAQRGKDCNPKSNSTAFVIEVNGKALRLDDAGNGKAVQALKGRQGNPSTAGVVAKVSGTPEGETIRVDTIDIQ